MSKKGTALLLISEGLSEHPSHIIDIVELLVKKEYESVVVLPYPDRLKTITATERVALQAINKVFSASSVSAIFHVENNDFIQSILNNDKVKQFLTNKNVKVEDYSYLIQPLIERMDLSSSQGRDALLIYKKRTDEPMEEPEFQAAMQICKNRGAVGVAVIMYKEIPYQDKQEWIDQINVIEPGFICSNEESDFLHEVLESSNISGVDIAIITAIEGTKIKQWIRK